MWRSAEAAASGPKDGDPRFYRPRSLRALLADWTKHTDLADRWAAEKADFPDPVDKHS